MPSDPANLPRVEQVGDLSVRHLGSIIRTNGYRATLAGLAVASDPSYIEVRMTEPGGVATTVTWVRPDMPAAVVGQ